jgi:hypothetical protein
MSAKTGRRDVLRGVGAVGLTMLIPGAGAHARQRSTTSGDRTLAFEFSGMCLAAPRGDRSGLDVLLISSAAIGMTHEPWLLLPTERVKAASSAEQVVVAGEFGGTFSGWRLNGPVHVDVPRGGGVRTRVTGARGEMPLSADERADIRWLPSLREVTGATFDESQRGVGPNVSAMVSIPAGGELFSRLPSCDRVWGFVDPGQSAPRWSQVIAERFIYTVAADSAVDLDVAGVRVSVALKDGDGAMPVLIRNLPATQMRSSNRREMAHFKGFYSLLRDGGTRPDVIMQSECGGVGSRVTRPDPCGIAQI